jgi:hypothetical protein
MEVWNEDMSILLISNMMILLKDEPA